MTYHCNIGGSYFDYMLTFNTEFYIFIYGYLVSFCFSLKKHFLAFLVRQVSVMNSLSFFVWESIYSSFIYEGHLCQVSILCCQFPHPPLPRSPIFSVYHSSLSRPVSFLLRNLLIVLCGLTCMWQVSFSLLSQNSLLIFEF